MMYYSHFGLSGAPFQFTPSPQMLFASRSHREGLAVLEKSFSHNSRGLAILGGPSGSGKTTLALAMLARDRARSRVLYLANPQVGYEAMLREILRQSGIAESGSQYQMLHAFQGHLGGLEAGGRILILIDEAHFLSDSALDQIAEMLHTEHPAFNGLSFALAGQLNLIDRIASARHQSLQRITVASATLAPFSAEESIRYVEYRLAAYDGTKDLVFADEALAYLLRHAEGSPLRINVLCHNAMLLAHMARERKVGIDLARKAVQEYKSRSPIAEHKQPGRERSSRAYERVYSPPKPVVVTRPTAVIAISRAGMGIGVLIISVLVISAVWLAQMHSPSPSSTIDGEVPAIFNDEMNVTDSPSSNLASLPDPGGSESVMRSAEAKSIKTGNGVAVPSHIVHRHQQVISEDGIGEAPAPTSSKGNAREAAN